MKRFLTGVFPLVLCCALAVPAPADEQDAQKQAQERRDIIHYGTDSEIGALIGTLRTEKSSEFDKDLIEIMEHTGNAPILTALFSFFAEREERGLENRALAILEDHAGSRNDVVLGAIDYLGKVKEKNAKRTLQALLDGDNGPFTNAAVRAYGRIADTGDADDSAQYLIAYYEERSPSNETQREIIVALGAAGSKKATDFLITLINNQEERYVLRIAALEAAGKIGDERAQEAVVNAVQAADPNVRSSAIGALGAFSGPDVDKAILDAFRDSFFRTRLGACEAAGKRKLTQAVPYLRYRALNDEAPVVRDEAVKALGAIDSSDAVGVLEEIFENERNTDRSRSLAAQMLVKHDRGAYTAKVTRVMEEAKKKNRAALAAGMERALAAGD